MGAETILEISAVFTESGALPTWFQWRYGDVSLRRRFYEARRTPAELTSLFTDYTESHGRTKNPRPSTPESWIGDHGETEPTDDMTLNVAPNIEQRKTDPLNGSVVVELQPYYLTTTNTHQSYASG